MKPSYEYEPICHLDYACYPSSACAAYQHSYVDQTANPIQMSDVLIGPVQYPSLSVLLGREGETNFLIVPGAKKTWLRSARPPTLPPPPPRSLSLCFIQASRPQPAGVSYRPLARNPLSTVSLSQPPSLPHAHVLCSLCPVSKALARLSCSPSLSLRHSGLDSGELNARQRLAKEHDTLSSRRRRAEGTD